MTEQVKTELELLKQQLDERGITYKANASKATLEKLLQNADEAEQTADDNKSLQALKDEALKLVHVIITPNDPLKQQIGHEYFGVGNSVLGTVARIVPFGENWLIENILLQSIKEKQTQVFISRRDSKGDEFVESKIIPAYQVVELPLPTKEEIEGLAEIQKARQSVE